MIPYTEKNGVSDSRKAKTFFHFPEYFHQIVPTTSEVLFEKQMA